jgi:hypothetical protein
MSRLSDLSTNPELRAYAQGTARQNLSSIASFLAPVVEVSTNTGHFKKYDDTHRFKLPDTRRALRGAATVLNWNASDATYNCTPNAIDVPVDKLESLEAAYAMDAIKEAADDAAEVAGLAHEQAVITKAMAAAGAGTNHNFTLDSVDPMAILDAAILSVSKAAKHSNLMEIGILMGPTAFLRYKGNKNVRAAKAGGGKTVSINLDDVSQLQIGGVQAQMSTMIYDAAAEGLPQDIQFLLDSSILVFVRKANPTRRDPSFMKTFSLRSGILRPRVYESPDGRVDFAAFDWSEDVQVTNSLAITRINALNV